MKDPRRVLMDNLVFQASVVMGLLREYGGEIVPHLMDTDDNSGERLRQAIEEYKKLDD